MHFVDIMEKKTVYLFYGEDNYSASQKCLFWRREFEKKYGDINVQTFEGKTLSAETFMTAVDCVPFLSEKKLIIVQDFLAQGKEEEQKKVAEKIEDIADFCVVVFLETEKPDARISLFKRIIKFGQSEEFHFIMGANLVQWIKNECKRKNASINPENAQLLAETVGPDLYQLKNEIEKLSLFCPGQNITADSIEKLVSPNILTSVFKLTDYLGQKRTRESLKIFQLLLESGEDLIKIFFMIVRQFRLLIEISDCLERKMNKTEITQKLKEHPFVIMNTIGQSRNFQPAQLGEIYGFLLKIDSDLKKGKIRISGGDLSELRLAVEKLIVELCK